MQIMITAGAMARTRVVRLQRWQIALAALFAALALMLLSGVIYHFVLVRAAQANWPIVSKVVGLVVRDEMAQRDRFMRENLDAIAERVGQMQARIVQLEAAGERVSGMVGVKLDEIVAPAAGGVRAPPRSTPAAPAAAAPANAASGPETGSASGKGGPFVPVLGGMPLGRSAALGEIEQALSELDLEAAIQSDRFLLLESRLLERRLLSMRVPSSRPVDVSPGSGFGFRSDPFTGRAALHTGLDFPADVGTPISAAAGGVILTAETHPAYGQMVEIDHGNGLITRYAHASRIHVKPGDLVKRGQKIAEVGSTGRSTGPHLHFEVLVDGVPQNPARFLGESDRPLSEFAARPGNRAR